MQFSVWTSSALLELKQMHCFYQQQQHHFQKANTGPCSLFFVTQQGERLLKVVVDSFPDVLNQYCDGTFLLQASWLLALSDIPSSISAKICWCVIAASITCSFIPEHTFAISQLVYLGGCMCWFFCPTKSSFGLSFTSSLQCPFLLKMHSEEAK